MEGRGAASGPDPQSPAHCLTASGELWSSDAADTLALPPWSVPRQWFSPRLGGGVPGGSRGGPALRCTARPCRCLSVPLRALCGAPGALQVVPHVPEAERWCHSLSQRAPLVPATVVCPVSSSLGGFQTVREACLSPPSVELGVTSSWSSSCGVPWGD